MKVKMTKSQLEEIKARLEASTPGPWKQDRDFDIVSRKSDGNYKIVCAPYSKDVMMREEDENFIVNAPTDIAALLSHIETLEQVVKVLDGAFEVDDLQAKLRGTRAELRLLKARADKLAEALEWALARKSTKTDNWVMKGERALKEYRGEK
jgi:hypothetical protein